MDTRLNCILVIDDGEPTNFSTQLIPEKWRCQLLIKLKQMMQQKITK